MFVSGEIPRLARTEDTRPAPTLGLYGAGLATHLRAGRAVPASPGVLRSLPASPGAVRGGGLRLPGRGPPGARHAGVRGGLARRSRGPDPRLVRLHTKPPTDHPDGRGRPS